MRQPKPEADLHTHTHFSDGRSSPEALLREAKRRGLRTIAITDHETTAGVREALPIAQKLGLELIPSIELTCFWDGYSGHGGGPDIDVLGYFINLSDARLAAAELRFAAALRGRAEEVSAALSRNGHPITLQDVLETHPSFPGFVALRDTLLRVRRLGSPQEAARVLEAAWQRAAPAPLSIAEAIALIREAGGVAVLAHPSIVHRRSDGEPLAERGVSDLLELGLGGLEVLHYRLSAPQRRHFALLARMHGLAVTGGSDEHGGPPAFTRLAQEPVSAEMVRGLRARSSAGAGPRAGVD